MSYGSAAPDANLELANKFVVEIDGIALAAFEKVKLPDLEWAVGETRTGIDALKKQTYSGLQKPGVISLEKALRVGGVADIKKLLEWARGGSTDRRSGSIFLTDRDGQEVLRFNFKNGWASKAAVPEMDASADSPAATFTFEISVPEWTVA